MMMGHVNGNTPNVAMTAGYKYARKEKTVSHWYKNKNNLQIIALNISIQPVFLVYNAAKITSYFRQKTVKVFKKYQQNYYSMTIFS